MTHPLRALPADPQWMETINKELERLHALILGDESETHSITQWAKMRIEDIHDAILQPRWIIPSENEIE